LQFGDAVALYFAFLASYTHNLIFISVAGLLTYYFGHAYSILYSFLLFLWSVVFVEYWRIRERLVSVAWCSLGSVRVEKHRPIYIEGHRWWKRELKILFSVPVIILFASVLAVLLTAIFVLEAFVATLYTGPGQQYIVRQSLYMIPVPPYLTVSLVICPNHPFGCNCPSLSRNLSDTRAKTD
jgi:anoctamin-10